MRTIYLVRHGLSQANNRENIGTPAFGAHDAELMDTGIEQARIAGRTLIGKYALLQTTSAAISTMRRTRQTAEEAGFTELIEYNQLDEIPVVLDDTIAERRARWHTGQLDDLVLEKAFETLLSPPKEQVWFTHGLRIAGICRVLDQYQDAHTIPKFGEVREVRLDL